MLGSNTSKLSEDKNAVRSNLILVLSTERGSLFGDPYFGSILKSAIFEQPTSIITDLLIDEIYTSIITYIPQVFLDRKDITITYDDTDLYANIRYTYIPDNTSDLYVINLTNSDNI
jgi:phage baseplate assembly protein W